MKNKKAQISSQVFIYIMAAVIAVVILLVGYKAISTLLKTGSQVPVDNFRSSFESNVAAKSREYGSQKAFKFTLPNQYDQVCFVDSMNNSEVFPFDVDKIGVPMIKNSVNTSVKINVFLLHNNLIEDSSFYVPKLDVQNDYLCLNNTGNMEVWLKGQGDSALLYSK